MRIKKFKLKIKKWKRIVLFFIFHYYITVSAQAVSEQTGAPFDLTLTQILRISITNGGNIEFVFNTIDQYRNGISNSAFYDTHVQIASSSDWQLHFGAEDDLLSVDAGPLVLIDKNNVGFTVVWDPLGNSCCAAGDQVSSITGNYDNAATGTANGLKTFMGDATDILFTNGAGTNAGDITDNNFTINWECGTRIAGTTNMNLNAFLDQIPVPVSGRYVTTVFLDLEML